MIPVLKAEMFNREAKKGASAVIGKLNIRKGETIADIGSGGGFFVFEFAHLTGESGKVYAADTDRGLLGVIEKRIRKENISNVKTVMADKSGPGLPASSCDLIFMRDVFHHIADPAGYFSRLKGILKPGARLAVIDWKPASRHGHGTPEEKITAVMEAAGFGLCETFDFLEKQSFNIFEIRAVLHET